MIVNVYNQTNKKLVQSQKQIANVLKRAGEIAGADKKIELTITVVDDKKIRFLNKKYRHKDKVTDVLSFSQKEGNKIILPKGEEDYLGDMVICYPQVIRQAKKFKQTISKEFGLLLIHGFLHLVGYDDKTKKDWQEMEKIQNKIFSKIYDRT